MGKKRSTRSSRRAAMRTMHRGLPLKMTVYIRDKGRCAYCDREIKITEATLDHINPIARGGETWLGNLALACADCNNRKGAMSAEEFRKCTS